MKKWNGEEQFYLHVTKADIDKGIKEAVKCLRYTGQGEYRQSCAIAQAMTRSGFDFPGMGYNTAEAQSPRGGTVYFDIRQSDFKFREQFDRYVDALSVHEKPKTRRPKPRLVRLTLDKS